MSKRERELQFDSFDIGAAGFGVFAGALLLAALVFPSLRDNTGLSLIPYFVGPALGIGAWLIRSR